MGNAFALTSVAINGAPIIWGAVKGLMEREVNVDELVSLAELHRPESVRFIDRYATWFTPAILLCAATAWIFTGDISRAVAVLIVGCPCALILAAPTATVAALGRAARAGILVKGGQYAVWVG